MAKLIVSDVDVQDKKVLMRADFNVPVKDNQITNDNRIVAALPTIKYIIEHQGKLILLSHLGRVKSAADKAGLTLKPVAQRLSELLNQDVKFIPGLHWAMCLSMMPLGQLIVLMHLTSGLLRQWKLQASQ